MAAITRAWAWASDDPYHFYLGPNPQGTIIHSRQHAGGAGALEIRLENTLAAWTAMYGITNSLSSLQYTNVTQMLLGTGNTNSTPAWNLTYNAFGNSSGFTLHREPFAVTNESTVMGMTLMALQGVVPTTTSLAIPLQENHYEDTANIGDHDIFNINLTAHTLTISLVDSGNVTFLYGSTPVNYTFTNGQGIYLVQFASDWNSITSVTYNSALPSNRIYLFSLSAGPAIGSLAYTLGILSGDVNWTNSVYTYYVGYQFGQYSLSQLQKAIDLIPTINTSTYNYIGGYAWQSVLYWYVTCAKYGIENQTTIEWALDNASMLSDRGLPLSGLWVEMPYFSTEDRYLLWLLLLTEIQL